MGRLLTLTLAAAISTGCAGKPFLEAIDTHDPRADSIIDELHSIADDARQSTVQSLLSPEPLTTDAPQAVGALEDSIRSRTLNITVANAVEKRFRKVAETVGAHYRAEWLGQDVAVWPIIDRHALIEMYRRQYDLEDPRDANAYRRDLTRILDGRLLAAYDPTQPGRFWPNPFAFVYGDRMVRQERIEPVTLHEAGHEGFAALNREYGDAPNHRLKSESWAEYNALIQGVPREERCQAVKETLLGRAEQYLPLVRADTTGDEYAAMRYYVLGPLLLNQHHCDPESHIDVYMRQRYDEHLKD